MSGVSAEFALRLQRYADVIVQVGLNLRAGQRLLIAEPFELQGVSRESQRLVEAVHGAAWRAGTTEVDVIWGDEARWRAAARGDGTHAFERELEENGERMRRHAREGGALLFLQCAHPGMMSGIPAERIARLREVGWKAYGRVAPDLIAAHTNWTTAPAPSATWALAVYAGSPAEAALGQLWSVAFAALRADCSDPATAWRTHLTELEGTRLALNERRPAALHFEGPGTDLRVATARAHRWCTAVLHTRDGRPFVANLPTEEVFTAPDPLSAEGVVRVARPIAYGGGVIAGAELDFRAGKVVRAHAEHGGDLLRRLLATDRGAARLGEVALVPRRRVELVAGAPCFHHALLDENALDHIALGQAYPFAAGRAGADGLNQSLVHVDLPIDARVWLVDADGR